MPTPDRRPGPLVEEEVQLEDNAADPSVVGAITFNGGAFKMKDVVGLFDPRSGSGGITETQHKTLRQLIHFIDDGPAEGFLTGAFKEILPSGSVFPTSEIWWKSSSKIDKIVELGTTWSGVNITQEEWKVYDTDGSTVLATITDAISYSSIFETTRTRTIA